MFNSLLQRH